LSTSLCKLIARFETYLAYIENYKILVRPLVLHKRLCVLSVRSVTSVIIDVKLVITSDFTCSFTVVFAVNNLNNNNLFAL
jgi:hypothetical protein